MLSDAAKRLREDKRLHRRNGWISSEELAAQLDALPDVSHKCAVDEEETEETAAADAGAESVNPS